MIQKFLQNRFLFILFRIIVGFIFIYAGLDKISNLPEFAKAISNYRLLPVELVNIFAIILPWIEVIAGVLILMGFFIQGGSLIILGLLITFTIAITINLVRGVDISCGCKTPWATSDKISLLKLLEEIVYIIMIIQVFLHDSLTFCLERFFRLIKNKT